MARVEVSLHRYAGGSLVDEWAGTVVVERREFRQVWYLAYNGHARRFEMRGGPGEVSINGGKPTPITEWKIRPKWSP